MKIWILEIGEPLPLEPNARMHRYGAYSKWLASKGHDVTWWTTSFSHAPKKNFVDRDCDIVLDGVTLRIMHSVGYGKNISLARIRHNKRFADFFRENANLYPKPDMIIAPIPIIEAAYSAVEFGRLSGIPVIVDIRDLWPGEIVDIAPPPMRPLARIILSRAYEQMKYVCSNATAIIGVAQSSVDYGLQFAQREQCENDFVFPLGYTKEHIADAQMDEARKWIGSLGIRNDSFKLCFFGTLGRFFDIPTVITAAREIEEEFPIDIIFGGAGSSAEQYKKLAADLPYLIFPGWLNSGQIAAVMEISHAGLACYKPDAKMSLPNKPFEYMAGGLPIISSIQKELKNYLQTYNCGLTYQADSVNELKNCIRLLKKNPALLNQMGINSRALLDEHFATDKVFFNATQNFFGILDRARLPLN